MAGFERVYAEVSHRLDQLTNPTFDRGTIAALMQEFRLIQAGADTLISELEAEIERQSEAIDDYEEEAATDHRMIAALRAEIRNLHERLAGRNLEMPVPFDEARMQNQRLQALGVGNPAKPAIMARLNDIQRRLYADSRQAFTDPVD